MWQVDKGHSLSLETWFQLQYILGSFFAKLFTMCVAIDHCSCYCCEVAIFRYYFLMKCFINPRCPSCINQQINHWKYRAVLLICIAIILGQKVTWELSKDDTRIPKSAIKDIVEKCVPSPLLQRANSHLQNIRFTFQEDINQEGHGMYT